MNNGTNASDTSLNLAFIKSLLKPFYFESSPVVSKGNRLVKSYFYELDKVISSNNYIVNSVFETFEKPKECLDNE